MSELKNTKGLSNHKLFFSDLGFGYVVFGMSAFILQFILAYIVKNLYPSIYESDMFLWFGSFLPMYMLSLPLCMKVLKNVPKTPIEKNKLGINKFFIILIVCLGGMYSGNFIGLIFSSILESLTGLTSISGINDMILSSNIFYLILFPVILAPLVEEFLFRKLLIDRVIKYGEVTAIVLSGVLFGLFHGNFEQFFYAAFLGMIFAYVYVRTGKIRYTIIYHMIINFIGSIIPLLLLSNLDSQAKEALLSGNVDNLKYTPEVVASLGYTLLYSLIMFTLSIIGVVIFLFSIKKLKLNKNELGLSKSELFISITLNLGMLSFIIICVLKFIFSFI